MVDLLFSRIALLAAISCTALLSCPLQAQDLLPSRVYRLNGAGEPMSGDQENTLRPCDIAIDQTRNLAFVAMSLTAEFPIVDLISRTVVRTISTPFVSSRHKVVLSYHSLGWRLLAVDADRPERLLSLNALSGETIATFVHPSGTPVAGVLGDGERNVLYVTDGTELIRILDASSLRTVDSIRATGMKCSGIAIDSIRKEVLVISRTLDNGRIIVRGFYTVSPHPVLRSLSYFAPEEADIVLCSRANRRIIIAGRHHVLIANPAGVREATIDVPGGISDADLCDATGTLYIADEDGYVSEGDHGRAGKIHAIDLVTKARDSLRVGYGVRRIAVYQKNALLLAASEETNDLVFIDCYTGRQFAATDLGESAESLAYDPDSAMLYAVDRLGEGNGIAGVDVYANTCQMLRSGTGPTGLAFDRTLRTLYSLDHFQSSITAFLVDRNDPPASFRIGVLPEARSDALSHLAIDPVAHLLLACIPELGAWALLDGATRGTLREGAVDGYAPEREDAAGLLQGAVSARLDRVFILRLRDRKLNVSRLSDGALLFVVDLRELDWVRLLPTESDLLYLDERTARLYVGPNILSAVDGALQGVILPGMNRVVGLTEAGGRIIGLDITADSVALAVHETGTGIQQSRQSLFAKAHGAIGAAFDPAAVRLFVSEARTALIRQYDLLHVAPAERTPAAMPLIFGAPYPFPATAGGWVSIPYSGDLPRGEIRIDVFDRLGRAMGAVACERGGSTAGSLAIDTRDLPEGLFFLRIHTHPAGFVPILLR